MTRNGFFILLLLAMLGTQGCTTLKEQLTHVKAGMDTLKAKMAQSGSQSAGDESQAQAIASALDRALLGCSETVWPAIGWKDFSLVLIDNRGHMAWVWNEEGDGKLTKADYTLLPEGAQRPVRSQGQWKDRKAVFIALDGYRKDNTGLIEAALEEAFRLVGQEGWNTNGADYFQGDLYPEEWPPRQLRRQLIQALFKAFTDRDRSALAGAIYWHRKHRADFPGDYESMHFLDRMAGSAAYVAVLSAELGLQGCGGSLDQLHTRLRERIRTEWLKKWGNLEWKGSAKDVEPYAIGLLAGLLLDQESIANWKQRVAEGETPMEVLSDAIEASPIPDDDRIFEQVKAYYETQNQQMRSLLTELYASQSSSDYVFLALPMSWLLPGSFDHKRLLAHKDEEHMRKFILGMDARFGLPSSRSKIELEDASVEIIDAPYPLGGYGYYVIPVRSSHLKAGEDGSYSITTDTVKATELTFELHESLLSGKWILVK